MVEVEPEDEDMEEVFPTIGPYQCEICQIITDTKVEFVEHIEGKHSDVVDEEVLLSLKSDIRKSKKKNGASEAPPPPPPKKPSPKKAAPTPPPKKAAPAPPPKKAAPTPPPKKATPAPPPKKAAAPPPQPKKAVGRPPAPEKAPTPSPKPEAKKGPASKTQSKPMGPASKTKPGPKPKSQPTPQAVVAGSVKSPAKEKFHSWLCDICDTMVPRSSPSEIARHKNTKSCQSALKRKKAAENKVDVVDDPLGGLETVPTYGASAPVVVMDNAEEDILEPQDQEDDNSDDHSGAANGNGKPMVEIQNGHRERQKERGPPKPILNFWDDTPAEEYASQFDKVVVESYSNAEFFTKLPEVDEEIETYKKGWMGNRSAWIAYSDGVGVDGAEVPPPPPGGLGNPPKTSKKEKNRTVTCTENMVTAIIEPSNPSYAVCRRAAAF